MDTGEVLVVGHDRALLDRWPVLARVPPHVAVLRAGPDDLPEIAPHTRLAVARTPAGGITAAGDASVLADLDQAGRVFVAAWHTRTADKPGRTGEGLSWDAPGFQPPDRPG
jgi:hypothetical protein